MKNVAIGIACLLLLLSGVYFTVDGQSEEQLKFVGEELLPPNAKPGECYARVFVAPEYKQVTEKIIMQDAASKVQTLEPEFELVEEKIMIKEPGEKLEIIPAEYAWVEEKVLTQPEHKHLKPIPAEYETVTEQVLERPAHTVWKKGTGPIQRVDHATGEIMCLVEVPAKYKTIEKKKLVKPATTEEVITPAKYITMKKRIMKTPPTTRKIEIPAEYKTVKVRKLKYEAKTTSVPIEAKYKTITKNVKVSEGRMEWQPILCETNVTSDLVTSLQKALKTAGFNPGSIDGRLGGQTMAAVEAYQRKKGLPRGQLTFETLQSLGVQF